MSKCQLCGVERADPSAVELAALRAKLAEAIRIAGEAIGTDPSLRSVACVQVLADRAERLSQQVEELTRERDSLRKYGDMALENQVRVEQAEVKLDREMNEQYNQRSRAQQAEAKLSAVVEALKSGKSEGERIHLALAAARAQPTQDKPPLGHAFMPRRDDYDSCNWLVSDDGNWGDMRCSRPKSAHQPTQDKP